MFNLFRQTNENSNYTKLCLATAVSNLGDGIAVLALPWLATLLTRDPVLIALVAASTRLPWLLFVLIAGVLTDRFDRRWLMVQADFLRVFLNAVLIVLICSIGSFPPDESRVFSSIAFLCVLAFALGMAEVLRDNAAQTLLPSVVDKKNLEKCNGQLWSIEQVMGSFVGPPLAGALIALSVVSPFAANALAFMLAALLVRSLVLPVRKPVIVRSFGVELNESIRWIRAHPVVLHLALMLSVINAFSVMALTVLVLYSQEILQLSAAQHGMLLTAGAIGGVLGGVVCPKIAKRIGSLWSLRGSLILFPIPLLLIGLAHSVWLVVLALFLEVVIGMLWNVVTVSYRQRLIPDELLGRVNSIYRFFGWGSMPIGALLGGVLVSSMEPSVGREMAIRLPYLLSGVGASVLAVYGFLRLRI